MLPSIDNRMHVDLRCADVDRELARRTKLGARTAAEYDHLVTLTDPEGNGFCVLR